MVAQLVDLQRHGYEYARQGGLLAEEELFYAERNAVTVQAAERYYRSMFGGRVPSWNLRGRHLVDTLEALVDHLGGWLGAPAKIVVWAHNSHLGDARATEAAARGEVNYFHARVADQFDAVIHIDETRAVEPIERTGRWEMGEAPETYPFAV